MSTTPKSEKPLEKIKTPRTEKNPRGAGRKLGQANLSTQQIADKLAMLGCDPLEGVAKISADMNNPVELRTKVLIELVQYIHPKRRAVETIVTDVTTPKEEDVKARLDQLIKKHLPSTKE